ncbi:NAD(+)/NADH kinase [Salinigranum salinum]|uniref:NAD(+)/NADH kinase n=1 Tax=Salinigranum salinum TaxID=1364937 RepID=UPI001260D0E2|nr:NAD(+)/NADH kinase [Salinigranum salinum]
MSLTVAHRGDDVCTDPVARLPADVSHAARESAADLLLAVGDDAVCSLVTDPAPIPAILVDADVGRHGVSGDDVADLLRTLAGDPAVLSARTVAAPRLSVTVDGDRTPAVLDVALVTSEAAHISEYTVADPMGPLASFRADGVVVATPLGSAGYAHAAGGPVLTDGDGLAVVPISPYTTGPCTWVTDAPVTLGVERDEAPVSLVVDGTTYREIGVDDAVLLEMAGTIDLIRPLAPTDGAHRLEKL